MPRFDRPGTSRSSTVYGLLLNLYPREYLRHHRAEMLQNFEDFEHASSSRIGLWLFVGKDLALSVITHFAKSRWGQSVIVVAVLIALLAAVGHRPDHHERTAWGFCGGYLLGWYSGWWRKERQLRLDKPFSRYSKSFLVDVGIICFALVMLLILSPNFFTIHEHAIWALCYGYMIAVPAGWLGKRWQSKS